MKVLFAVFCLQVILAITVPPQWSKNDKITYKNPTVHSTVIPLVTEQFKFHSFFPEDAKPSNTVTKLQYRSPNNQQSFVYHPQPSIQDKKHENHTPSSYQIIHFDKANQGEIVTKKIPRKGQYNQPPRQHLTETNPPIRTFVPRQRTNIKHTEQEENKEQNKEDNKEENIEETAAEEIEEQKENISEHEFPREVPTKPIYPGEGQWAKYGLKHRPYIHPNQKDVQKDGQEIQVYIQDAQEDVQEAQEDKPEGYETFEKGQEKFNQAQNNHRYKIDHQFTPSQIAPTESSNPSKIGFIPEKLYTQVRRTESEEHLPRSAISPEEESPDRLREIVKDSKIHTVYTEEGYEDSAYDHAGHEKNAEDHEGHAEKHEGESGKSGRGHGGGRGRYSGEGGRKYGGNNERRRLESSDKRKNEDYKNTQGYRRTAGRNSKDIETAGSEHEAKKVQTIPSKNVKKITLKNGKNEDIQMEIHTEVKYTPQKKKHKYIKIVPSTKKVPEAFAIRSSTTESSAEAATTYNSRKDTARSESARTGPKRTSSAKTEVEKTEYKPLKRVKRYDKVKLSKMYKRQRPSYYWNRIKTTTTVRPIKNSRKNFEDAFQTHNSKKFEDYEDIPEEYMFKTVSMKRTTKPLILEKKSETTTKTIMKIIAGPEETTKIHESITDADTATARLTTAKEKTIKMSTSKIENKTTEKQKKTTEKENKSTEKKKTQKEETIIEKEKEKTSENITTAGSIISTSTQKPEDIHPDLLNPELTTRISKPSSPKTLPVKIRKFKAKRQKRFTNDFPKIKVDLTEFTDVRKFPDPVTTPDMTHIKYPYYNIPKEKLNENSALRYGEDMKNIPKKIENELSFYESREHVVCPEIEKDVNPIPERVENQEEGEETDKMAESPNLPRLKGLGDKIDCLKEKYFGEDPLDSPFFSEETINDPEPFFSIKSSKQSEENNSPKYIAGNAVKRELKIKLLEPIVVLEEDLIDSATINPIHQNTEAVLKPPYTLLEMMSMNKEQFVTPPRNIYDQITFLEQNDKLSALPHDQFIIIYDNQDISNIAEQSSTAEVGQKEVKVVMSTSKPQVQNPQFQKAHVRKAPVRKRPAPIKKLSVKTIRKPTLKTTPEPSSTTQASIPTISTTFLTTTTSQRPTNNPKTTQPSSSLVKPILRNTQQSQRVVRPNNIAPTTINSQSSMNSPATVVVQQTPYSSKPLVRTIQSQIMVKQNNTVPTTINSQSTMNSPAAVVVQQPPYPIKPLIRTSQSRKMVRPNTNWQTANGQLAAFYNIFDISRFLPKVPVHRWGTKEAQTNIHSDVLQNINNEKENKDTSDTRLEAVIVPVPQTETNHKTVPKITETKVEKIAEPSETIAGKLLSSNSATYTSLTSNPIQIEDELQPDASQILNYYYFIGMTPPNSNKNISPMHSISKRDTRKIDKKNDDLEDLLMEESRYNPTYINIRSKRNTEQNEEELLMEETENNPVYSAPPQRKPKVYTEIIRQRYSRPPAEAADEEEEEADLNPRKRIYQLQSALRSKTTTSKPAPINEETNEDLLEDFLTEPPEPTTTSKPIIYPVEANSKNSTVAEYIFFIEKLQEKWAKEDATSTTEATTTTKNPIKTISNQVTAESVNARRGEPAYLQIITQLHDIRKDEDITSSSTTASSITEKQAHVRNSNPFIFEGFMSELNSMKARLDPDSTAESTNEESIDAESTNTEHRSRNFSTRFNTNIDTSKYKTIERAPVNVRHNLSSRFNAEDGLPLLKDKTTQTPMIIAIISRPTTKELPKEEIKLEVTTRKEPEKEEKQKEQEVTSTTTVRSRQRGRSRRPSYTTSSRPTTVTSSVTPVTPNPNFRRRRPTRVTTPIPSTTTSKSEAYRRRNRQKIVSPTTTTGNTKEDLTTESIVVVTPVSSYKTQKPEQSQELNSSEETSEPKKQRRFQKVQERHVMSEVTLTRFFEPESDELDDNSEESRKHQYEVISPLKQSDTLHGGNYKHEHDRKLPRSSEEDIPESLASSEGFFTDPKLAEDVNQLKEGKDVSSEKKEASNRLLSQKEIEDKVAEKASKVNLFPNVARMVNRLAEIKTGDVIKEEDNIDDNKEENKEENSERPTFIKDPSRRMYYYAKL